MPDETLEKDAAQLQRALAELLGVYRFRDRQSACCCGLSAAQSGALGALMKNGPMTLNGLAAALYLDKSTASRVISALAQKDCVCCGSDECDRRALKLEVTAQGRKLYAQIRKETITEMKKMLADFEPEIRQAIIQLVARLARAATKFDPRGASCSCR